LASVRGAIPTGRQQADGEAHARQAGLTCRADAATAGDEAAESGDPGAALPILHQLVRARDVLGVDGDLGFRELGDRFARIRARRHNEEGRRFLDLRHGNL
jgi:hypothetical protein